MDGELGQLLSLHVGCQPPAGSPQHVHMPAPGFEEQQQEESPVYNISESLLAYTFVIIPLAQASHMAWSRAHAGGYHPRKQNLCSLFGNLSEDLDKKN